MVLNFIVDPLQFYRKSFYFNNVLYLYQRYQNPGLARNYGYDTVIIGTSMTENFLPRDTKSILDLDVLKLSISGGSVYEQRLMLNVAMRSDKLDNVIWGIDFSSFKGSSQRKGGEDSTFPEYLYDTDLFNDFKYLLNDKTTELSINALIKLLKFGPAKKDINIDRYSFWYPYVKFGEEIMIENGKKFVKSNKSMGQEYDIDEIKENIDKNLIDPIRQNPNVSFHLFYTPASVLREIFFISEGIYEIELEFKNYINRELLKYRNVKIYDFQAAEEIITDFDRYSDYSHYDLETMVYMLECIRDQKYLVTEQDDLLEDFKDIVDGYKE